MPGDCTPKADPEAYESDKNDRPKSQLNSRPNTVKPQEGGSSNGNNNQMAAPEEVEASGNKSNGARIKRPNTSTLRRADSGIGGK